MAATERVPVLMTVAEKKRIGDVDENYPELMELRKTGW